MIRARFAGASGLRAYQPRIGAPAHSVAVAPAAVERRATFMDGFAQRLGDPPALPAAAIEEGTLGGAMPPALPTPAVPVWGFLRACLGR